MFGYLPNGTLCYFLPTHDLTNLILLDYYENFNEKIKLIQFEFKPVKLIS